MSLSRGKIRIGWVLLALHVLKRVMAFKRVRNLVACARNSLIFFIRDIVASMDAAEELCALYDQICTESA